MTRNKALAIKHIVQYCVEINSDCDNCSFYDTCYSENELNEAKEVLGEEGKELENLL